MKKIKKAKTDFPVLKVIKDRWSARSFSEKPIAMETLKTIFEAASWAASANNEQPWQYIYSIKGNEGFKKICNCLREGNQPWAKKAAVLVVAIARNTFELNQSLNDWAVHDVGMANAHILLQAVSMDIYCHPMAGFTKELVIKTTNLSPTQEPICIIAMGYLGEATALEEPFKEREMTKRSRKKLSEFVSTF
jgi:nitroreductase